MPKEHISIKSEMDKLPQRLSPEGFDSWLETAGKNEMQIEFNKLSVTVDVIILSYCNDEECFRINYNCINSLLASEEAFSFNIIIIESNKHFTNMGYHYHFPNVRVIIPSTDFNFNRFLICFDLQR